MTTADVEGRRRASPRAVLAVVGFGVFIAADDLTVVSTMLRPIIADLGLVLPDGLDEAAWIVNVYLIAYVAAMPLAGRISDVFGRRRTFVGAYVVFIVGSVIIPLSGTLEVFLVGRVLTAVGGGAMVPVALAVIGDAFRAGPRSRALGTLGAIDTLGWVWGPMYGAMLVRFLSWEWQFWLNVPLAVGGLVVSWWVLADYDEPHEASRVDWVGAAALTLGLVAVNLALLGNTEVQSVTGFEELTGGDGRDFRWLYLPAVAFFALLVWRERRSSHPLFDPTIMRGRNVRLALLVNLAVGAVLIIAMVDVPLFVNAVEVDVDDSAVVSGLVLSALTASMAVFAYLGGRWTESRWFRPPIVAGLAVAAVAFAVMGWTWDGQTSYAILAAQLALLGAGFGLVIAPTTSAVVDAAPPPRRGSAASMVMMMRLIGLSIGLSALTAWGLARFNSLRSSIELPAIDDPGFDSALREAQQTLTAESIADTFLASGVVVAAALLAALAMRRAGSRSHPELHHVSGADSTHDREEVPAMTTQEDPPSEPQVSPVIEEPAARVRRRPGLGVALAVLAVLLAAAVAAIVVLFVQLRETRDDLERVEAGAALVSTQLGGLAGGVSDALPELGAGLDDAIAGLEEFRGSTLRFDVPIDETVELDTEVLIQRDLTVPIDETIPIQTTIDTTIEVSAPFGLTVPVDVSVPVDVEFPLRLDVDIPVDETLPLSISVPVALVVPVEIDVGDTPLADLARSLESGLRGLRELLGSVDSGD